MKMNKKQFIFSPVWSHMSGSSKGRLLGKESGAGSQESQQGEQGKALSDKGTVPRHLNREAEQVRDSNQGQLTLATARRGCNNKADLRSRQKAESARQGLIWWG